MIFQVHCVLPFDQSPWLENYIDFNTFECTNATNDFEKDFVKLKKNSVFGKTKENLRNRRKTDLVTSQVK